jgi:hypothetical protein
MSVIVSVTPRQRFLSLTIRNVFATAEREAQHPNDLIFWDSVIIEDCFRTMINAG